MSIVSCACWSSVYIPCKNVYLDPLPIFQQGCLGFFCFLFFVFLMISCMSSLYILNINPLSDIPFEDIFSHSVSGLFFLLIVSFSSQKCFSLMQSHFLNFYFFSPCLGRQIQKNITETEVKQDTTYVFFQKFYNFRSYI